MVRGSVTIDFKYLNATTHVGYVVVGVGITSDDMSDLLT